MKIDRENGLIEVSGFDIGNKILVSSADEVTVRNDDTGEYEKTKEIKVIIQIEDLKYWIEDYGLLDEIELINL